MAEQKSFTIVEGADYSAELTVTITPDVRRAGVAICGVGVCAQVSLDLAAVERLQVVLTTVAAHLRAAH